MGAIRAKIVIECNRKVSNEEIRFVVVSYTNAEGKKENWKFQSLQEAERFLNQKLRSLRVRREDLKEAEVRVITAGEDFTCKVKITFEPSPPRPRIRPR